jgi:hypothetical protein
LLNITPDNSKKFLCKTCNKYITDKRKHYNTENHKSKISKEEWTKQIKELDENTRKKKVNVDTDVDVVKLEEEQVEE